MGDEWIDATRGRAYDDDEAESSTYFHHKPAQGQKRKKAPFFKYSKKKKGQSNPGSSYKGCVSCFRLSISDMTLVKLHFTTFLSPSFFCGSVVVAVVTTVAVSRRPAPKGAPKVLVEDPGTQGETHQQAGDQDSWLPRCLKAASGHS